jgi:hypothetical protein
MHIKRISVLFLFFLLLISQKEVIGVGIGRYDNTNMILFQPNIEKSMSYYLFDSGNIDCTIEGELAEYAKILDSNPGGGSRNIDIQFKFPEYLDPGLHTIYVVATQKGLDGEGAVGGIASVRVALNVFVLYPGKQPEIQLFSLSDTNVEQNSQASITIINNGEEEIESATSEIDIYDENNNLITTIKTNSLKIKPFEKITLTSILETASYNMPTGQYRAVARVIYDGRELNSSAETKFIIGKLSMQIVDTTREVIVNATNKYYIVVESDWSGNIDNIYARITMPNGKIIKTPNVDIIKSEQGVKAKATIESYMETDDLAVGTYDIPVTLYYKGQTSEKTVKLTIIEGIAPDIKKPSILDNRDLLIVSAAVIIGIIIYIFIRNKKSGGSTKSGSENSSSDIKPPTL